MDNIIKALQQVHEEWERLKAIKKTRGVGLGASQVDSAKCKEQAHKNYQRTLVAIEAKRLTPEAKQAAIKAAQNNIAREISECEH